MSQTSMQAGDRIVFCDFDGTITQRETLVAMLIKMVPMEMTQFSRLIAEKKISLKEAVKSVVESIPADDYKRAVDFIREEKIRPGFLELLKFLKKEEIPFVVISGGLMDSVVTRLEDYMDYIHAVYAPEIDAAGDHVKVISKFENRDELISKVQVMSLYNFRESIAIGDGATDFNMALNASIVFARRHLADFLDQEGKDYVPWHDFFDIKQNLINRWRL